MNMVFVFVKTQFRNHIICMQISNIVFSSDKVYLTNIFFKTQIALHVKCFSTHVCISFSSCILVQLDFVIAFVTIFHEYL